MGPTRSTIAILFTLVGKNVKKALHTFKTNNKNISLCLYSQLSQAKEKEKKVKAKKRLKTNELRSHLIFFFFFFISHLYKGV